MYANPACMAPRQPFLSEPIMTRIPRPLVFVILAFLSLSACTRSVEEAPESATIDNNVDGVVYTSGDWEPHLPAGERGRSAGNHRAIIKLDSSQTNAPVVVAEIVWRRPDSAPQEKAILLFDAATMDTVKHAAVLSIDNHSGTIAFAPVAGSNTYYAYYMPYETTGGYYPNLNYLPGGNDDEAAAWLDSVNGSEGLSQLPASARARATEIQSVDDFHSFFPMEVVASESEVEGLLAVDEIGRRDFYYFPEDRDRPIRMNDHQSSPCRF